MASFFFLFFFFFFNDPATTEIYTLSLHDALPIYGEERGHAERDECPDKEEGSAGLGQRAANSRPLHVDDRDKQSKERPEEDDDVPRSPSCQHHRSVQPDGQDRHHNEVKKSSRLHPSDNVVRRVKGNEEDREYRCNG